MDSPSVARSISHGSSVPGYETQLSNELLVTFIGTSGEEECAVVRIADTYKETLLEACASLAPWLPAGWQDRRRDFAREVRNRKGDMIWAAVQPALVLELGRLGRLPEIRLRIHPPVEDELGAQLNNSRDDSQSPAYELNNPRDDSQSPAYEAIQQPSAVDGIVQAVLQKLQNQNERNNIGNPPASNTTRMSAENEKKKLEELWEVMPSPPPLPQLPKTAADSPTPPPLPPRVPQATLDTPMPPMPPSNPVPSTIPSHVPVVSPRPLPSPSLGRVQTTGSSQLPTPRSLPNSPPLRTREPTPTPQPGVLLAPGDASNTEETSNTVQREEVNSVSLGNVLQSSIKSMANGHYGGALKTLRSALSATSVPSQRAKLSLWQGQISCELKEYHNACADIAVARELFMSLGDHSGRLECGLVSARIDRICNGAITTMQLSELLEDAKRQQIKQAEVDILCELCELGCGLKSTGDMTYNAERAKSLAQTLGDLWCGAAASRVSGMVSEVNGDFVSALQSYSAALELYQRASPRSPLLPTKKLEESIERMRGKISSSMDKQGRTRFKLF